MAPQYFTDEEIISAANIVPAEMMFKSKRSARNMQKLSAIGIKTCVVVWLDDTIAFISFEANLKMPPAAFIISEYRKHHNLPLETANKGGTYGYH